MADDQPPRTRRSTTRELISQSLARELTTRDLHANRHLIDAMEQRFDPQPQTRISNVTSVASSESHDQRRQRLRAAGTESSPLFVMPALAASSEWPPLDVQEVQATAAAPAPPRSHASQRAFMARSRQARRGSSNRPFLTASDRYVMRIRAEADAVAADAASTDELLRASRQLEAATSNLRALLDTSTSSLSAIQRPGPVSRSFDPIESAHRNKRRKLDTGRVDGPALGVRYGRYGQIVPGRLKMEIVSCDGGIFQGGGQEDYSVENVLKRDATVYCTKSNRCNLILQHQGGSPFELRELIVKAPHSGYTAPVQAGMVFISMTSDDLLTRTAQYQIQYSAEATPDALTSTGGDQPSIMSVRHSLQGPLNDLRQLGFQDNAVRRRAQIPTDFTENALPFNVVTECSDSESDDMTFHPTIFPLQQDRQGEDAREDTEDEDNDAGLREYMESQRLDPHPPSSTRPRRRETMDNIIGLSAAVEASQVATQEAVKAVGGELMVPHARFFIEPEMSKCTIRFEPPVTGRFVLLKMFSPQHNPNGNIDIQSVLAVGYAGPRLFPAITLR